MYLQGPLACLPVPYRTNETWPRMTDLKDPTTGSYYTKLTMDIIWSYY